MLTRAQFNDNSQVGYQRLMPLYWTIDWLLDPSSLCGQGCRVQSEANCLQYVSGCFSLRDGKAGACIPQADTCCLPALARHMQCSSPCGMPTVTRAPAPLPPTAHTCPLVPAHSQHLPEPIMSCHALVILKLQLCLLLPSTMHEHGTHPDANWLLFLTKSSWMSLGH